MAPRVPGDVSGKVKGGDGASTPRGGHPELEGFHPAPGEKHPGAQTEEGMLKIPRVAPGSRGGGLDVGGADDAYGEGVNANSKPTATQKLTTLPQMASKAPSNTQSMMHPHIVPASNGAGAHTVQLGG